MFKKYTWTIVITIVFLSSYAYGATYYVAVGGSNSNNCSQNAPCATMVHVFANVMSGCDTLYVRGGSYSEEVGHHSQPQIPSCNDGVNYTLLSAYPGETVFNNKPMGFYGTTHHAQINGFDISTNANGMMGGCCEVHHVKITNNRIHDAIAKSTIGISGYGSFFTISGNEIFNIRSNDFCNNNDSDACYGMYISVTDSIVEDNIVYNNDGYGIQAYLSGDTTRSNNVFRRNRVYGNGFNGGSGGSGGFIVSSGNNNQVYNNLIYGNAAGLQLGGGCSNCKAWHNTVYGNNSAGVSIENNSSTVKNNISFGNIVNIDNWGGSSAGNISPNFTSDPLFVGPTSGRNANFALQSGSNARNSVTCISGVAELTTDFNGSTRPQPVGSGNCDYGAVEFNEGGGGGGPLPNGNPIFLSCGGHSDSPSDGDGSVQSCINAENITTPKATILGACACLNSVPGKVLEVRSCNYLVNVMTSTNCPIMGGNTSGTPTTIRGYNGEIPVFQQVLNAPVVISFNKGGGVSREDLSDRFIKLKNLVIDGLSRSTGGGINILAGAHDIVLENVSVRNTRWRALDIESVSNITIIGGTFENSLEFPLISVYGSNNVSITDAVFDGSGGHCLDLWTSNGSFVARNKIQGCTGVGIALDIGNANNVGNNVVVGSGSGIQVSGTTETRVYYNTVADNVNTSIVCSAGSTGTEIKNNIVFRNGTNAIGNNCGASVGGNFSSDPLFVGTGSDPYSLQAGSSAIGTGVSITGVTQDVIGNTRPFPPGGNTEPGAYESQSEELGQLVGSSRYSLYWFRMIGK